MSHILVLNNNIFKNILNNILLDIIYDVKKSIANFL